VKGKKEELLEKRRRQVRLLYLQRSDEAGSSAMRAEGDEGMVIYRTPLC
jgi:hypothetical protein